MYEKQRAFASHLRQHATCTPLAPVWLLPRPWHWFALVSTDLAVSRAQAQGCPPLSGAHNHPIQLHKNTHNNAPPPAHRRSIPSSPAHPALSAGPRWAPRAPSAAPCPPGGGAAARSAAAPGRRCRAAGGAGSPPWRAASPSAAGGHTRQRSDVLARLTVWELLG